MKVSAIQSSYLSHPVSTNKQNHQRISSYQLANQNNPSFNGFFTKAFAVLAAKIGHSVYKDGKVLKNKRVFNDFIRNPQKYSKNIDNILNELSNTQSNLDKKLTYAFRDDQMISIEEMKRQVLENVFPKLSDENPQNRFAKQAFLTKLFDNGEYNNKTYVKTFSSLPDDLYGTFKESVADKILYSVDNMSLAKHNLVEDFNIYNVYLLNSLDLKKHKEYYTKNAHSVDKFLSRIMLAGKDMMTTEHNKAYSYYAHDFLCINNEDYNNWRPMFRKAFYMTVQNANGSKKTLAQSLNVDVKIAENILKDYESFIKADKVSDKQQKLEIYTQRLNEKFRTPIRTKHKWYEFGTIRDLLVYGDAYLENKDINTYIERTGFAKELNLRFANKLHEQASKLSELKEACDRSDDMYSDIADRIDITSRV